MIHVYGKARCPKCEALKAKLDLLHQSYVFHDITDTFEGWRDTLCVEARAFYEMNVDANAAIALPTASIGDTLYTYPQLMKHLRA